VSVLFIIPARGGSKGLPGKNIREIAGKPLIAWSIEAAQQAAEAIGNSEVIISTDSEEIAEIARKWKGKVPFIRPAELASDTAASIDVILHAVDFKEKKGKRFDYIAMIEPTSPQRDAQDLVNALAQLNENKEAESIVGICKTESCHPLFLTKLNKGFLVPYENKSYKVYRRQDIDDVYFFEGSMYISKTESLKKRNSFYHEKTLGCIMPKWKSLEIDDEVDFIMIEALLKARKENILI
jgi:CMP-N,N'-diacetyllegionaminic acid synthase